MADSIGDPQPHEADDETTDLPWLAHLAGGIRVRARHVSSLWVVLLSWLSRAFS